MIERRRELRRRRKRKKEKAREKRKVARLSAYKQSKPLPVTLKEEKDVQREHQETLQAPFKSQTRGLYRINWDKVRDLDTLIVNLPDSVESRKIWPHMPENMKAIKEQIIQTALKMKASRQYAAPGEWNGGLKEALILMKRSRMPRGFEVFLNI